MKDPVQAYFSTLKSFASKPFGDIILAGAQSNIRLSTKPWWVGVIVMFISLIMMGACTIFGYDIGPWESLTSACIGYVVGLPMGAMAFKA